VVEVVVESCSELELGALVLGQGLALHFEKTLALEFADDGRALSYLFVELLL